MGLDKLLYKFSPFTKDIRDAAAGKKTWEGEMWMQLGHDGVRTEDVEDRVRWRRVSRCDDT